MQQQRQHHRLGIHVLQLRRVDWVEAALLHRITEGQVPKTPILVDVDLTVGVGGAVYEVSQL
ncbi:MAG: hypothetical protein H6962_12185 [Chromatiaceae bacterium]|nr:hypothetical protein [Chromatiaceae bacterium]